MSRETAQQSRQGRGASSSLKTGVAALVAMSFLAAACGGTQMAEVRVEPAGQNAELGTEQRQQLDAQQAERSDGVADDFGDPVAVDPDTPSTLGPDIEIQSFTVANVPPITLPDLSVLSETGSIVSESLGSFVGPESGLDVVSAQCTADGGELVYSGSEEAPSFLDIDHDVAITEADVNADGSGTYSFNPRDDTLGNLIQIEVNADGSGTYKSNRGPDPSVSITVNPDGSGTYKSSGEEGRVETTFRTDIGILDPQLLVMGPEPVFAVADRFPPLAKLGSLRPPCVTIIRVDTAVLFDFDSDQLRPEAAPVVESVAAVLATSGKAIEVHGHTDSKGDDDYNQDLSERRAASFVAALIGQGVSTEISTEGFGETRPVAPNETADGTDDPAARQLNRRIEIVIPE